MVRWKPENSVAIVTGASSGIGYDLSRLLALRGATVVALARRADRIRTLAATCETENAAGCIIAVEGDVTSAETRKRAIESAARVRDGAIDLLVNNAGIGAIGPFASASPERLRRIMEVNFFAPVEFIRESLDALCKGRAPVICNVGSVLGHRAVPDKSEYCASKFALHGFSDSLRAELRPQGIQVTLVSPSTTKSEFFSSLIDTDEGTTSKSFGSWTPVRVARSTLAAIQSRRSEVILSLGGKALVYADRFAPPIVNAVLAK